LVLVLCADGALEVFKKSFELFKKRAIVEGFADRGEV
jgi:hypothetical protein